MAAEVAAASTTPDGRYVEPREATRARATRRIILPADEQIKLWLPEGESRAVIKFTRTSNNGDVMARHVYTAN